jgi:hypothetical protein
MADLAAALSDISNAIRDMAALDTDANDEWVAAMKADAQRTEIRRRRKVGRQASLPRPRHEIVRSRG